MTGPLSLTISAGKALIKADKWLNKGALQDQFDRSAAQVNAEVGQVAYAVAKAIVAHSLEKASSDEDVDAFMAGAAGDPSFPARAYRLLGEAKKSSSTERRRLLAATLFGLPLLGISPDSRDRIDVAVERLMPDDVLLLGRIVDKESRVDHSQFGTGVGPDGEFAPSHFTSRIVGLGAVFFGGPFRLGLVSVSGALSAVEDADPVSFTNLNTVGCVQVWQRAMGLTQEYSHHPFTPTPLGFSVFETLKSVAIDLGGPNFYAHAK